MKTHCGAVLVVVCATAAAAAAAAEPFVFYKARSSAGVPFRRFGPVELVDRFGARGFAVSAPQHVGLPAALDGAPPAVGVPALADHAIAAMGDAPRFAGVSEVEVVDACGRRLVEVERPVSLLVPTRLDFAAPPDAPLEGEHGLDHYTCYAAKPRRREAAGNLLPKVPRGMQVDAGDGLQTRRYDLRKPTRVCVPTATGGAPRYLDGPLQGTAKAITPATVRTPGGSLVCYQARPATKTIAQNGCGPAVAGDRGTRIVPRPAPHAARTGVYGSNPLAGFRIDTVREAEVCLPADVRVCGGTAPGDDACITARRIVDAFTATDWDVQLLLTPADIPLPTTNVDASSYVFGMYNPSVVWSPEAGHLMTLGLSIYCQNGFVARDSVGLLQSDDGIDFDFVSYLVEPDPTICALPQGQWPAETVFQVNDPSAVLERLPDGREWLYVVYTAVRHRSTEWETECANIGLAIVELGTGVIFREDRYLSPPPSFCGARPGYGFSRPNLSVLPDGSMEVWFDTYYGVYRAPIVNWSRLDAGTVAYSGFHGDLDVGVSAIGAYDVMLTRRWQGGPGLEVSVAARGSGSWTAPAPFTQATGEFWDRDFQATAELFTHPQTCASRVYLAGIELTPDDSWYRSINVGVATPAGGELGSLACATAR